MNTRVQTYPSSSWTRPLIAIAAISALALSLLSLARPASTLAFTAGDNGHPTSGPYSDLKGGSATFTFQDNATLTCDANDSALGFTFHIDYSVQGTLPDGARLVVYLSPNQGAINGNANGDEAGYIAAVEGNYTVLDVGGLTGSGTLTPTGVTVTSSFTVSTGGILGVFASQANGTGWTDKTNSLNCTEASSTPTPTPTPVVTPTPTPVVTPTPTPVVTPTPTPTPEESVAGSTGTPEQSVEAATGTPAPSVPNTAVDAVGGNMQLPMIVFGLLLIGSLGGLLVLNVKSVIERR